MRVLVACEESQIVCKEFRKLGHEAYSCDLLPAGGGHPEWHVQADAMEVCKLNWDLVIAHPPCDHLASSGARWFEEKRRDGRQQRGIGFFLYFTVLDHVPRVAIENPVGIMSKLYMSPGPERAKMRSRTYEGIAKAMASQWGRLGENG